MHHLRVIPSAVLMAMLLGSCAVAPSPQPSPETPAQAGARRAKAPPPGYNLSGYPPAVREGYVDGCESARRSAHAGKDEARFSADPQYRMGWNDGYAICARK